MKGKRVETLLAAGLNITEEQVSVPVKGKRVETVSGVDAAGKNNQKVSVPVKGKRVETLVKIVSKPKLA